MAPTLGVGFNGTAAILWGGVYQILMPYRLNVGERSRGMLRKFGPIVSREMFFAARANVRPFCNGLMIP